MNLLLHHKKLMKYEILYTIPYGSELTFMLAKVKGKYYVEMQMNNMKL